MSLIEIFNEGWCPACHGYVRPAWVDGGFGTVEWWGTRIRHEAKIPVCVWCGEELLEEQPDGGENNAEHPGGCAGKD